MLNANKTNSQRRSFFTAAELATETADLYALLQNNAAKICENNKLPDKQRIKILLQDFKKIIFNAHYRFADSQKIRELLENNWLRLARELEKAFSYQYFLQNGCSDYSDLVNDVKTTLTAFKLQLPKLKKLVLLDIEAIYKADPSALNYEEILLCYPGLEAIYFYRFAHELELLNVPFLPRIISYLAKEKTGIEIHPQAQIGEALAIDHGTGIVIGSSAVLGKGIRLYQGVTLGASSIKERKNSVSKRHPTLEDEVIVYANATILGGTTVIGKRSIIGANVFICESVAPDTIVEFCQQNYQFRRRKYSGD